jgi:hypothetical protein
VSDFVYRFNQYAAVGSLAKKSKFKYLFSVLYSLMPSSPPSQRGSNSTDTAVIIHEATQTLESLSKSALDVADIVAPEPHLPEQTAPPLHNRLLNGINSSMMFLVKSTAKFALSPPAWYFRYTFMVSVLIQLAFIILLEFAAPESYTANVGSPNGWIVAMTVFFQVLQVSFSFVIFCSKCALI